MLSFCSRLCSHLCFLGRQVDKISALSGVNRSLCAYFMHARLKGNLRNPFFPLSKPVLFLPAPPGSRYGSWLQAQFVALFHRLRSSVWSSVYHMLQITTVTSLKRQGLFTSIGLTTHLSSPQPADWAHEDWVSHWQRQWDFITVGWQMHCSHEDSGQSI